MNVNLGEEVAKSPIFFARTKPFLELLLSYGANPNIVDIFHRNPIIHALNRRVDAETFRAFLEVGRDQVKRIVSCFGYYR